MNADWHKKHPMPKRPTMDQRVRWHAAHAKACACREMSAEMAAEVRRLSRRTSKKRAAKPSP